MCVTATWRSSSRRGSPQNSSSPRKRTSATCSVQVVAVQSIGHIPSAAKVAVKVLKGSSNQQIEVQFMADLGTIGRIHHVNLVRLIGFCFENNMRALGYEFMEKGSLDGLLFRNTEKISFDMLHEIALGTAQGIGYLLEESQQRMGCNQCHHDNGDPGLRGARAMEAILCY
ncbi:hypothetical protein AMTR_s00019p00229150 [Amborella trichopoda]|uniref:Serine-threonine/tyrosine-protein kinase catalytic domain-containing protein n=1 Tax=Amborella trichopoda TaxID=13333 RepID=W1PJQ7_AMBTC|nr:hypothetical protein AMTR_s00019p00229150 [Amborella trichopoda]